jgi:hypothetical protein
MFVDSTVKIFLEFSYFTFVQTVCLFDFEVIDLFENCLENINFEFSVIFADWVENVNFEWKTNCKIETNFAEFNIFDINAWAINENFEFSMKSRIEFARIVSKLDDCEFFFNVTNTRFAFCDAS